MDMMKQFSLEGKVALITGAAYGIGFAIAEAYANCGAKIAFNCRGEKHMEEAMKAYAQSIDLPLIVEDDYGLRQFVTNVADDIDHRCTFCYTSRLERTAREAAERGFDSYTTSLLVSPYQNHEAIIEIGTRLGEQYGVQFLPEDFRPYFREGQERARALDIYMQKYCGCIFSEEDRYKKKKKKKPAEENGK